MLVTFSSNAYGSITLFGSVANILLKMMHHSTVLPSAILAKDVPAALDALQEALNTEGDTITSLSLDDDDDGISLNKRAIPLIALLTAAANARSDVHILVT